MQTDCGKIEPTPLQAIVQDTVYLNGGQRELQVVMAMGDIVRVRNGAAAAIVV